jgi:hypothetical protein
MGHIPRNASVPAIVNETMQMLAKKSTAARGRSEQFGAI